MRMIQSHGNLCCAYSCHVPQLYEKASGLEGVVDGAISLISFITQKVVIEVPPFSEISLIDQILTRLKVGGTVERCTFSHLLVYFQLMAEKRVHVST